MVVKEYKASGVSCLFMATLLVMSIRRLGEEETVKLKLKKNLAFSSRSLFSFFVFLNHLCLYLQT